jgi:energy-coupling factor transporter transmembrane protein EcfT
MSHPWVGLGWMLSAGLLTIVLYALFGPSDSLGGWTVLGITISSNAIKVGMVMALRLISLLMLSVTLLSSVPTLDLAAGFTRFLAPLRALGIGIANVYYLTFFLSRMIPGLIHESRVISLAQRSRGIGVHLGVWGRIRSYPAKILPIFASALRRSDSMSLVLASRGFDPSRVPRRVLDLRFVRIDYTALAAIGAGWAIWVFARLVLSQ